MEETLQYIKIDNSTGRPVPKENQKHYIGDIESVLYQYICDLNSDSYTFRCGIYAYNKIQNMKGFKETTINEWCNSGALNLNGENIVVIRNKRLDKKQLIISPQILDCYKYNKYDETIYPDDIVLYFA